MRTALVWRVRTASLMSSMGTEGRLYNTIWYIALLYNTTVDNCSLKKRKSMSLTPFAIQHRKKLQCQKAAS